MKPAAHIIAIGAAIGLSPRESAICALVHAGLGDKEIAAKLGGSSYTIRTHLKRIAAKLGAHSRVGWALAWERACPSNGVPQNSDATERKNRCKIAA